MLRKGYITEVSSIENAPWPQLALGIEEKNENSV